MKSRFPLAKRSTEFCSRVHGSNVALYAVRTYDVWSPNIESFKQYVPAWMDYPGSGVIEWESLGAGPLVGGGSGGPFPCEMTLDASRGSAEYVTGANLQVSALQALVCIKL